MINSKMLSAKIREKNLTQHEIAEIMGIKQSTLSLKINNKRPFFLEEVNKIAKIIDIPELEFGAYFFCNETCTAQDNRELFSENCDKSA